MADQKSLQLGIIATGIVMSKENIPPDNNKPERFKVSLAVPDCESQVVVSVDRETFMSAKEFQPFELNVVFNKFNNNIYWKKAA